jgi:hypothetical protein
LGITAKVNQTDEESWEDVPLSEVVNENIEKAIGDLVEKAVGTIQEKIDAIIKEKIESVFNAPFIPVDRWGEQVGESTTIRDMIAKEALDYWNTCVDKNGTKNTYGANTPRAVFYARLVMEEFYNKELVNAVKVMATELKARIPKTISDEITKTVLNHLK